MTAASTPVAHGWRRLTGKAKEQWLQLAGGGSPARKASGSSELKSLLPAPGSPPTQGV